MLHDQSSENYSSMKLLINFFFNISDNSDLLAVTVTTSGSSSKDLGTTTKQRRFLVVDVYQVKPVSQLLANSFYERRSQKCKKTMMTGAFVAC